MCMPRRRADMQAAEEPKHRYRALFDELLEVKVAKEQPMPAKQLAAHA